MDSSENEIIIKTEASSTSEQIPQDECSHEVFTQDDYVQEVPALVREVPALIRKVPTLVPEVPPFEESLPTNIIIKTETVNLGDYNLSTNNSPIPPLMLQVNPQISPVAQSPFVLRIVSLGENSASQSMSSLESDGSTGSIISRKDAPCIQGTNLNRDDLSRIASDLLSHVTESSQNENLINTKGANDISDSYLILDETRDQRSKIVIGDCGAQKRKLKKPKKCRNFVNKNRNIFDNNLVKNSDNSEINGAVIPRVDEFMLDGACSPSVAGVVTSTVGDAYCPNVDETQSPSVESLEIPNIEKISSFEGTQISSVGGVEIPIIDKKVFPEGVHSAGPLNPEGVHYAVTPAHQPLIVKFSPHKSSYSSVTVKKSKKRKKCLDDVFGSLIKSKLTSHDQAQSSLGLDGSGLLSSKKGRPQRARKAPKRWEPDAMDSSTELLQIDSAPNSDDDSIISLKNRRKKKRVSKKSKKKSVPVSMSSDVDYSVFKVKSKCKKLKKDQDSLKSTLSGVSVCNDGNDAQKHEEKIQSCEKKKNLQPANCKENQPANFDLAKFIDGVISTDEIEQVEVLHQQKEKMQTEDWQPANADSKESVGKERENLQPAKKDLTQLNDEDVSSSQVVIRDEKQQEENLQNYRETENVQSANIQVMPLYEKQEIESQIELQEDKIVVGDVRSLDSPDLPKTEMADGLLFMDGGAESKILEEEWNLDLSTEESDAPDEVKVRRRKRYSKNRKGDKKYQCQYCRKKFRFKTWFAKHGEICKTERPFICEICSKSFKFKGNLKEHMESHEESRTHKCHLCERSFQRKGYLQVHLKNHEDLKRFECPVCRKMFKLKANLKIHLTIHEGVKKYECDQCDKAFVSDGYLQRHRVIHAEKMYSCEVCSKNFRFKFTLEQHKKIHANDRPFKCHLCDKAYTIKGSLTLHIKSHSGLKPFKCEVCKKAFRMKACLDEHMKTHTGERPHVCDICQAAFAAKSNLTSHKRIHSGEKPYSCNVCGRRFAQSGHCKEHERAHTVKPPRPYSCDICNQSFQKKSQVEIHKSSHSNERPFPCPLCERTYKTKNAVVDHVASMHKGIKPHVCTVCNHAFRQSAHLREHMKIHSAERPFKCDMCAKSYVLEKDLDYHMMRHTGVKPWKCDICEMLFMRKSNLHVHMRIHNNEKPMKCPVCGKAFRQKSNLQRHLNIH